VRRIRPLLAPAGELVLNAVGGIAAGALLAALGLCTALPGHRAEARTHAALRSLARRHRARAAAALGHGVQAPVRPGHELAWAAAHLVAGPAGLALAALPLAAAYVLLWLRTAETGARVTLTLSLAILTFLGLAVAAVRPLTRAQARLTERLLAPGAGAAARIAELTASRAAVVDLQAAELRRVERDLHDGAQARLISIRMTLGLARHADPDQARELVREAWESTEQALADLRALVRGIHPPVLAERGLAGAVEAVALLCPVPVDLDLDLPDRLPTPVESTAYFAVAEALANVAEHSGATRARLALHHRAGRLRMTVRDDGHGGADPAAGTGLEGIRRRLSAFDGRLTVHSPPGGPSELIMELPCASSSPRTSPSSGTAWSGC
jgi:signal transduction histidine kinase